MAVWPHLGRRKDLLIADMDATIVRGETLDDLAAVAGVGDEVAAITARAMNGEVVFGEALRERVELLKDVPVVVAGAKAVISHGDLTALFYLQGYAGTEFRR